MKTNLMIACIEGNAPKMHTILVNKLDNINSQDINGKTALDYLIENSEYKNDIHAFLFFRSYGAKFGQELDNKNISEITNMFGNVNIKN